MTRATNRKAVKQIESITRKAKQAMASWMSILGYAPSGEEVRAWQAGYIAGINDKIDKD